MNLAELLDPTDAALIEAVTEVFERHCREHPHGDPVRFAAVIYGMSRKWLRQVGVTTQQLAMLDRCMDHVQRQAELEQGGDRPS